MWYLLVAAGAGYLATKWQNAQKLRSLCGPSGEMSTPSSPPASPKDSPLSNSTPTSPKIGHDPISGFKSQHQKLSANGFHTHLYKDFPSSPQEIKCNERSACKSGLVDSAKVERVEDPQVFTSNGSLPAIDIMDDKEEQQVKEEIYSSPSSCCSSNSTVINSPVDSLSILQRCKGPFQLYGKELGSQSSQKNGVLQFQGQEHFNELPNQTFNLSLNTNSDGERGRGVYALRQEPSQQAASASFLLDHMVTAPSVNLAAAVSSNAAAASDNRTALDGGIRTPLSFTGKRLRDDTRADLVPADFVSSQFAKFVAKQGTSPTVARKSGSLSSPSHSVASKEASNNMGGVDGDAFVSFGLAMAVCFMVSSGKSEMDKMEKVLKETEDLVGDMRKELEERKFRSSMDEEDDEEFFTIKPKDSFQQELVFKSNDTCSKNDPYFCDEESIRSHVRETAPQHQLPVYGTEESRGVSEWEHANTNVERCGNKVVKGGVEDGNQHSKFGYSEEDSDSEEDGENGHTMSMVELERKLWQVFQERQEDRISELEKSLELALNKLNAKEDELRWWKNRASWLMQQSFGSTGG